MDSDDEKLDGIVKIETLESEEITELNTLSDNEEEFHLGNKNGKYQTHTLVKFLKTPREPTHFAQSVGQGGWAHKLRNGFERVLQDRNNVRRLKFW